MANVFLTLPVPAGTGVGAWVDVSSQGPERTISVDGGAFDGTLYIETSNDGQASAAPAACGPFLGPTFSPQTFTQGLNFMRVRRAGSAGIGTPTVTLAAPAAVANVFGAMNVPAGDGVGTAIDISGGGDINTFQVEGPYTGQILIETSTDGVNFSPTLLFSIFHGVGQQVVGVLSSARVRRRGSSGGALPFVSVGSQATSGAGGGGFPGYGSAPPAITTAGAAGASALVSRSDHTHAGVGSAIAGTGISVSSATGAVTFTNTGVTSIIAGSNITISSATGAVTINSTGGGGGVATVTAGTAISITGTGTNPIVNNTGVTSAVAGTGVGVSAATGAVTFTNTGVTSIIAGTNITISSATGAVTINSTGGGGGVATVTAGTAISITGTGTNPIVNNTGVTSAVAGTGVSVSAATGAVTFTNTGVTSIIAGTNITISSATGAVTINSTGGGGGGTLASIYTAGLVSAALDNVFGQYSTDDVGALVRLQKARGTIGSPVAVAASDNLGAWNWNGWDGTGYTSSLLSGAFVSPGATISAGVLPSDWYTYSGTNTDPVGNNQLLGIRLFSNGVFGLNFPASTTNANLELPHTTTHETCAISVGGPPAQGGLSTALGQFRVNSSGAQFYNGGLFWEYMPSGNTAGSEYTQFGVEVVVNNLPTTSVRVQAYANTNDVRLCVPSGTNLAGQIYPGISFLQDAAAGFAGFTGPVGSGQTMDLYYVVDTSSTVQNVIFKARALNYGSGVNQFDFNVPGDLSCVTIGPNSPTHASPYLGCGIFQDAGGNNNLVLHAFLRNVMVEPFGTLANSTTTGWFGLAGISGAPTAQPNGVTSANKGFLLWDITNHGAWAYRTGTTSDFVPTYVAALPTTTRIPFASGTQLVDSANLLYDGTALVTPVIAGHTGSGSLVLENSDGTIATIITLGTGQITHQGSVVPSASASYQLGVPTVVYTAVFTNTVQGGNATSTLVLQNSNTPATSITLGSAVTTVVGNVVPSLSFNYDLGSPALNWNNVYAGNIATPNITAATGLAITSASNLTMTVTGFVTISPTTDLTANLSGHSFKVVGGTVDLDTNSWIANGTSVLTLGAVGPTGTSSGGPRQFLRLFEGGVPFFVPAY